MTGLVWAECLTETGSSVDGDRWAVRRAEAIEEIKLNLQRAEVPLLGQLYGRGARLWRMPAVTGE